MLYEISWRCDPRELTLIVTTGDIYTVYRWWGGIKRFWDKLCFFTVRTPSEPGNRIHYWPMGKNSLCTMPGMSKKACRWSCWGPGSQGHTHAPNMQEEPSTACWRTSWLTYVAGSVVLGMNFAATQRMFKSHVRIAWTVLYGTPTIAAMLWSVLRRSSCTNCWMVSTFSGAELVKGLLNLSSSSFNDFHTWSLCPTPNTLNDFSIAQFQNFMFALLSNLLSMIK